MSALRRIHRQILREHGEPWHLFFEGLTRDRQRRIDQLPDLTPAGRAHAKLEAERRKRRRRQ